MKPISPYTASQRYAARQELLWLLEIELPGEPWRAASKTVTVAGNLYPARIASPPLWEMAPVGTFGAGGVIASTATVHVNDDALAADSLRSQLERAAPNEIGGRLSLIWIDRDGTWTSNDAVELLTGIVVHWNNSAGVVTLGLRDKLTARWEKRVGLILTSAMFDDMTSPLLGEFLPIIIGRHESVELEPLRSGVLNTLRAPLGLTDPAVQLTSITGFPTSGTIQVGTELIDYTAVDAGENTLGTASDPITRGTEPLLHSEGEPVRSVPAEGFQWLVAGHPCALVENLRADDVPFSTGEWSTGVAALGAIQEEIVTMSRWPTRLRYESRTRRRLAVQLIGATAYEASDDSTALNPELAIDSSLSSTSARLADGSSLLSFAISSDLATGKLLGLWSGASLRVRYSATRRWEAGSQLLVRLTQGASVYQAAIPRPAPGDGGDETPIGIHEFELDLGPAIDPDIGWDAFAAEAAKMQIEFIPDADATEVLIHDFELFVDFFARLTAEEATTITARVEGWMDETGAVIENPADVIGLLMKDAAFGGLDGEELDAASLASIRSALSLRGFNYARRIAEGPTLRSLIDEAVRESAVWLKLGGGRARFALAPTSPIGAGCAEILDETKALDRVPNLRLPGLDSGPPIQSLSLVANGVCGLPPVIWSRSTEAAELTGAVPARRVLRWLDGRQAQALDALGERLWFELREPALRYTQNYPPGAALLEPGDRTTAWQSAIGLSGTPCWVESVKLTSASRAEVMLRGILAGEICWQGGNRTLLKTFGSGNQLTAFVNGVPAATIDSQGNLYLTGKMREQGLLGIGPFAEPIIFSGGFLYFCAGTAGTFVPYLRLDSQGNATLAGTVREQSTFSFTLDDECHAADSAGFRLTPKPQTPGLEYRIEGNILHLPGVLIEGSGV